MIDGVRTYRNGAYSVGVGTYRDCPFSFGIRTYRGSGHSVGLRGNRALSTPDRRDCRPMGG